MPKHKVQYEESPTDLGEILTHAVKVREVGAVVATWCHVDICGVRFFIKCVYRPVWVGALEAQAANPVAVTSPVVVS